MTARPVVLAILDGIGIGAADEADAVALARTPTLDALRRPGLHGQLRAHGKAVGLPSDDDMGNSEVGHNALGAGRVFEQGAALVARALADGSLVRGPVWQALMARCAGTDRGALHFIGLLSDGNVHSHQAHLHALLEAAAKSGCRRLYVHVLLDGRDVGPQTAEIYVDRLETELAALRQAGIDARIASGGGRMRITMDRYEADWPMVARGWAVHVHGDGPRVSSARAAIEAARQAEPGLIDQDLPAFVVGDAAGPVAPIRDGDGVVLFNFRGDRAIELTRAFEDPQLNDFDRGRRPEVLFAGMMQYDGDLALPRHFLVEPPAIDRTMSERLAELGITQLAIAETQKYGHVTYFWNGNRSGMFDPARETYIEIASDNVPFEQRPWMKAAEVTDRLVGELATGRHRFLRVNYANGDMVGHTGSMAATIVAVEAVDLALARLVRAVDRADGILIVTADHGNADEMFQRNKHGAVQRDRRTGVPMVKTSHTLNPVPFLLHDQRGGDRYELDVRPQAGIGNIAATCFSLLGLPPPDDMLPSLVRIR